MAYLPGKWMYPQDRAVVPTLIVLFTLERVVGRTNLHIFTKRSTCVDREVFPRQDRMITYTTCGHQRQTGMKSLRCIDSASDCSEGIKPTAQSTAARCPPARPPASTATHRPMPYPSDSVICSPCGAPERLGVLSGGQCGFVTSFSCVGCRDRS